MRIKELLLALAAIVVVASCGLLPCTQRGLRDRPHAYSMNSLKQIGLALHAYHEVHRKWPPAVVTDKQGKPLYSWRVLLLPFLEENELYKRFMLDEPWDSPANRKLLDKTPGYYLLFPGDDPPGTTRYQAIVGPGTAWERPDLTFQQSFPDGLGDTIMVAEPANAVPWSKPADLEFDPKGALPVVGGPPFACGKPFLLLCDEARAGVPCPVRGRTRAIHAHRHRPGRAAGALDARWRREGGGSRGLTRPLPTRAAFLPARLTRCFDSRRSPRLGSPGRRSAC